MYSTHNKLVVICTTALLLRSDVFKTQQTSCYMYHCLTPQKRCTQHTTNKSLYVPQPYSSEAMHSTHNKQVVICTTALLLRSDALNTQQTSRYMYHSLTPQKRCTQHTTNKSLYVPLPYSSEAMHSTHNKQVVIYTIALLLDERQSI